VVTLDPLHLIVRGVWASETLAGFFLDFEGAYLRAAAVDIAARGPRRSLRTTYLADNASLLQVGQRPWYHLVLFGEPGYFKPDKPPPPDGYVIIVIEGDDEASDY
jgi:hypothetical protein